MALLDFVIKFIYDIVFLSAETETPIPVRLFIHELFFLPFKLGMLHVFLSNLMASTLASQALKIIIGSVLFSKCFIFAFALDLDVSIESISVRHACFGLRPLSAPSHTTDVCVTQASQEDKKV
eukprot:1326052-Amorphochlora_amoeboformis.AAC.2